jgi:hypothetical protein
MSKMDNLRAMREARYDKAAARAKQAGGAKPAAAPVAPAPAAKSPAPEVVADASAEELCGHRNMSGRTCTREKGHAAKSHRYS